MGDGHALAGSLDALVSGRRASPRCAVCLDAFVRAATVEFQARVLNLSRGGALLSIGLEALGGDPGQPLGPAEQFALLEGHFRDTLEIHIPSCGLVLEAQVLRLVMTGEEAGALGLGCRFVQPLSDVQQTRLGIRRSTDAELLGWSEAARVHDVRWVARSEHSVTALLVDATEAAEAARGPLFLGPIKALGARALIVRLLDVTLDEVQDALLAPGVCVHVHRGARSLYVSPTEPVATRYIDSPRPGVEVILACGDAVPRGVRKYFRRG